MKIVVLYQDTETIKKFYGEKYTAMEETHEELEVVEGLKEVGHEAVAINIDKIFELPECDVVFNLCDEFEDNRAPKVPMVLDNLGIKFTGASAESLKITYGKKVIKEILQKKNVLTPKYLIVELGKKNLEPLIKKSNLKYPLIVKPVYQDGSFGIGYDSVANNYEDLLKRVKYLYAECKQDVMIEEFISGREFSISIVGNEKPVLLPVYEIIYHDFENKPKIMTYEAKWVLEHEDYKNTSPECPANIPKELQSKIQKLALKCFKAFKCCGYARVDFRLNEQNELYVLEINTNPSLLKNSEFVYAAKVHGWNFSQLLDQLVKFAAGKEPANAPKNRKELKAIIKKLLPSFLQSPQP